VETLSRWLRPKTEISEAQRNEGFVYLAGFIFAIWLANWLIGNWGTVEPPAPGAPWLITVWPGELTRSGDPIYAPSGVLAIGAAFTLRDLVQRRLGLGWTVLAIVVAAGLSAVLDTSVARVALASGVAVLLAEGLDLLVYTPLQRRNLIAAVLASNVVGVVVDSVVFLSIAFSSLDLLEGQIIGKLWMTLAALPIVVALRAWDRRRGLLPA
jgi:uncharacterized PurR-regulated membrane protein YhhQ (DUF165 family)